MPEQLNDPLLEVVVDVTLLFSLATCVALVAARFRGPLLGFRPRRPVPWNGIAATLLVFLAVSSALSGGAEPKPPVTPEKTEQAVAESDDAKTDEDKPPGGGTVLPLLTGAAVELSLVIGVLLLVNTYFGASIADFGISLRPWALSKDIFIGIVVGIAALAPIRIIQAILLTLCGMPVMESGHPLVKMLRDSPPGMFVMISASFMAMVIAPVCEEITFRLLFQGWLEKWEYERTAGEAVEPVTSPPDASVAIDETPPNVVESADEPVVYDGETDETRDEASSTVIETGPSHGIAHLPFGLVPIVVSSLLFGLAHFGYGPEPVSMFFLALMLGYVYFRTHSIVPSIVAHMVFNSFTMFVLWRLWMSGAN